MTASVLQEKSQARTGSGTTRASTAFTSNCTVGSTIEAWVIYNGAVAPTGVADGASQSYTLKASDYNGANDYTLALYIFQNNASATQLVVTATWAASHSGTGVWTREIGGVTSTAYQTSKHNYQATATTSANAITTSGGTGSMTPTSAPALISAMSVGGFLSVNNTHGSAFTGAGTTGFGTWGTSESLRVTTTSTQEAEFTNTTDGGSGGLGWVTIGAIYTEAGGASSVLNPFTGRGGGAAQPLW